MRGARGRTPAPPGIILLEGAVNVRQEQPPLFNQPSVSANAWGSKTGRVQTQLWWAPTLLVDSLVEVLQLGIAQRPAFTDLVKGSPLECRKSAKDDVGGRVLAEVSDVEGINSLAEVGRVHLADLLLLCNLLPKEQTQLLYTLVERETPLGNEALTFSLFQYDTSQRNRAIKAWRPRLNFGMNEKH
jgi:hypothetical protein